MLIFSIPCPLTIDFLPPDGERCGEEVIQDHDDKKNLATTMATTAIATALPFC